MARATSLTCSGLVGPLLAAKPAEPGCSTSTRRIDSANSAIQLRQSWPRSSGKGASRTVPSTTAEISASRLRKWW
jgi:hypothetical protein